MTDNFFEAAWNAVEPTENDEPIEETPDYLIRDAVARFKLLADLLNTYYHAKHGTPLKPRAPEEIAFHLKGEK